MAYRVRCTWLRRSHGSWRSASFLTPFPARTRLPDMQNSSMRIPFYTSEHAVAAKRALEVDKEQNAQFVHRTIEAQDSDLVV